MKLFYRMNLKDHPTVVQDLWHDVALWRKELREIFRPVLDQTQINQTRQVPAPIIESLLACQDEDGLCRLLVDGEMIPSDARVDFWYWPTYFLTASLIRAQLLADQTDATLPPAWSGGLKLGLLAASFRKFAGHGMEDEDVRIEVLNFYLDAGLMPFLAAHGSEHPEFAHLVTTILENQRQAILSGKARGGFTDYTQPWLDLQARTGAINHLFTYGTLMTGQRANRQLTAHPRCQLVGTAILKGFRLYDLGAFPAILPAGPGDCPAGDDWLPGPETSGRSRGPALVVGEVYRINHDQLAGLDAYEGEGSLYLRRAAVVETIAGQRELAWIYVYNHPVDPAREVSLGLQPWNGEPFLQFANRYVWYVAYGSNLLRERFLCYIRGGWFREIRSYDGCRDQNLPIIDLPCQLPYVMYFGNQSATWQGGGVAFLDASQKGKSQGRAYLITRDQFNDIHRQEGRSADWYDRRLDLGHLSGIPVATFTNHGRRPEHEPGQQYLAVVREGIAELHGRAIP